MEINRIKYFRTVYETESIRRAAELLSMTPGALSKSVKTLEEELGEKLFLPQGRNIIPSEYGKRFYNLSSNLVQSYEKLRGDLKNYEVVKPLVIATWEVFSSYFAVNFLAENYKNKPIQLVERVPNDLERSILSGESDIGITYAPIPHPDLDILKICKMEYGIFTLKGKFENMDILKLPFAVPITSFPESPTGVKTLDNWPEDRERTILYQFELLETALEACRQGLCVVFCPKFVVELQNEKLANKYKLIEIPSKLKVKRDVHLIKRKTYPENTIVKKLAKSLRTQVF